MTKIDALARRQTCASVRGSIPHHEREDKIWQSELSPFALRYRRANRDEMQVDSLSLRRCLSLYTLDNKR